MAIAFKGDFDFTSSETSGTTLVFTSGALGFSGAIGDLVVIHIATDNLSATTPTFSVSSSVGGNTWNVIEGARNATAAAGVASALVWSVLAVALPVLSTVTVTASGAVTARCGYGHLFTGAGGLRSSGSTVGDGSSTTASVTNAQPLNGDLVFGAAGLEQALSVSAADSDTTNGSWSSGATIRSGTGGLDASHVRTFAQYKIVNADGSQTFDLTNANTDWVAIMAVFAPRVDASPSPDAVALSVTAPTPSITASPDVAPAVVTISAGVDGPEVLQGTFVVSDVVALAASIPEPAVHHDFAVAAPALAVSAVIPEPFFAPPPVQASVAVPTPAIHYETALPVAAVARRVVIPAPTIDVVNSIAGEPCLGCGQAGCNCDVVGDGLVIVTGHGNEGDPFIVEVACDDVMDCISSMFSCLGFTVSSAGVTADGADDDMLVAVGDGCAEWAPSMPDLWFLYDTRNWDGGLVLYNEGLAGSHGGDFDLDYGVDGSGIFFRKDTLLTATWAEIGGDADTAGVFFVVAFADTYILGDSFGDTTLFFNHDGGFQNNRLQTGFIQFTDGDIELSMGKRESGVDVSAIDVFDSSGTVYGPLIGSVVVGAMDAATGDWGYWIDGVQIPPIDVSVTSLTGGDTWTSPTLHDVLISIGQDDLGTTSGKLQEGAFAMGWGRINGALSAGQLQAIQDYFT